VLGVRDQPYLLGIGNDDAFDVRRQEVSQCGCIAGSLDHHLIIMGEFLLGKCRQTVSQHRDTPEPGQLTVLQRHDFCRNAVDIHADDPHAPLRCCS
jgi:hypothetical protein